MAKEFSTPILYPGSIDSLNVPDTTEETYEEIERFMPVVDEILATFDRHEVQFDEAYDILMAVADVIVYMASEYQMEQYVKDI